MAPDDIAAARRKLGLSAPAFALMLGYSGEQRRQMTYALESGRRELHEAQRRLLEAYLTGYRPADWPCAPGA
jgi:DNA-binding transcriptional regulator YiaG